MFHHNVYHILYHQRHHNVYFPSISSFLYTSPHHLIGEWHLGNAMKTYDVIGDHRCNTYDVEKVPSYVTAMKGLREGTYVECCRKIDG